MTRNILYMLCFMNCWVPMLYAAEPLVPHHAEWQSITKAIREGKPKTGRDLLAGIEQSAIEDKHWDEVARAIATRVLLENSDRPADDPQRLIDLDAATKIAPVQTRGVLQAIQANWTWGFFQSNRWRFAQRTIQAQSDSDHELSEISSWDLRQIVIEIRYRFEMALATDAGLKKLLVGDWAMLVEAGSMGEAYRPTLWDVVAQDAIAFHQTGERGIVAPEDAFELEASSPALQEVNIFRHWQPVQKATKKEFVTDTDSPILQIISLYQQILNFHADDTDQTAYLSADLDRLRWAREVAVADGETEPNDRFCHELKTYIEKAEDYEISAMARFSLGVFGQKAQLKLGASQYRQLIAIRKVSVGSNVKILLLRLKLRKSLSQQNVPGPSHGLPSRLHIAILTDSICDLSGQIGKSDCAKVNHLGSGLIKKIGARSSHFQFFNRPQSRFLQLMITDRQFKIHQSRQFLRLKQLLLVRTGLYAVLVKILVRVIMLFQQHSSGSAKFPL